MTLTRGLSALRSFMRGTSIKAKAPVRARPASSASLRAGTKGAEGPVGAPPPISLLEESSSPQFCFDPVTQTYKRAATQSPGGSPSSNNTCPVQAPSTRGSVNRCSLPLQDSPLKRGQCISAEV